MTSLPPVACGSFADGVRIAALAVACAAPAISQEQPPAVRAVLAALAKEDVATAAQNWPELTAASAADAKATRSAALDALSKRKGSLRDRLTLADAMLAHPVGLSRKTVTWVTLTKGELHRDLGELEAGIKTMHAVREVPGEYGDVAATCNALTMQLSLGRFAAARKELDFLAERNVPDTLALCSCEYWLRCGVLPAAMRALASLSDDPALANDPYRNWLQMEVDLENERFAAVAQHAGDFSKKVDKQWRSKFELGEAVAKERRNAPDARKLLDALATGHEVPGDVRAKATAILANRALRANRIGEAAALLDSTAHLPQAPLLTARARVAARQYRDGQIDGEELLAVREELAASWQRELASWRQVPLQADGIAFLQHAPRRELLAAWFACTLALAEPDAAEQCLAQWLQADSAASAARRKKLDAVTLADVRQHLVPRDGKLLCYLPAPQGSYLIEVDSTDVTVHALRSDRDLREHVRKLRHSLRPRHDGTADPATIRAHAEPLGWLLPATSPRINIAGRELLAGMPFECLPTNDEQLPWLGLTTAIGYTPNCALSCRTATAQRPSCTVDARLTATTLSEDAASEAGVTPVTLDANELAEVLPVYSELVQTETAASWQGDAQRLFDAAEHAAFHAVFAHGVFDGERATPAGILLADANGNGVPIHAEDAPTDPQNGPADLVLLGVCSAARGNLQRGDDGARHLGGALLQAGAMTVALADFDLEVTRLVMISRELLTGLATGSTPDIALRNARRTVHASGYASPADWAQLRVEGLAHLRVAIRSTTRTPIPWPAWVALVIAVALAAIGVFTCQRRCASSEA